MKSSKPWKILFARRVVLMLSLLVFSTPCRALPDGVSIAERLERAYLIGPDRERLLAEARMDPPGQAVLAVIEQLRSLRINYPDPKAEAEISIMHPEDAGLGLSWFGPVADFSIELLPGVYQVRLQIPGEPPNNTSLQLPPSSEKSFVLTVQPATPSGFLVVQSVPKAEIMDGDGKVLGLTGSKPIRLEAGVHVLVLRAPGYAEEAVHAEIVPGQTVTRKLMLAKAVGGLRLKAQVRSVKASEGPPYADPDVAHIELLRREGTNLVFPPVVRELVSLPYEEGDLDPGDYVLKVKLRHYESQEEHSFSAGLGEPVEVVVVGDPWPRIIFTSQVKEAQVFAVAGGDSHFLGGVEMPIYVQPHTIHHLEIRAPGYRPHGFGYQSGGPYETRVEHVGLSRIHSPGDPSGLNVSAE